MVLLLPSPAWEGVFVDAIGQPDEVLPAGIHDVYFVISIAIRRECNLSAVRCLVVIKLPM